MTKRRLYLPVGEEHSDSMEYSVNMQGQAATTHLQAQMQQMSISLPKHNSGSEMPNGSGSGSDRSSPTNFSTINTALASYDVYGSGSSSVNGIAAAASPNLMTTAVGVSRSENRIYPVPGTGNSYNSISISNSNSSSSIHYSYPVDSTADVYPSYVPRSQQQQYPHPQPQVNLQHIHDINNLKYQAKQMRREYQKERRADAMQHDYDYQQQVPWSSGNENSYQRRGPPSHQNQYSNGMDMETGGMRQQYPAHGQGQGMVGSSGPQSQGLRRLTRGQRAHRDRMDQQLRVLTSRDNFDPKCQDPNYDRSQALNAYQLPLPPQQQQQQQQQRVMNMNMNMHPNSLSNHQAIYGDMRNKPSQAQARSAGEIYTQPDGGMKSHTYTAGHGTEGDADIADSKLTNNGDIDDITLYDDTYVQQALQTQQYPSQQTYVPRSRNTIMSRNRRGQGGRGGIRDVDCDAHTVLVNGILHGQGQGQSTAYSANQQFDEYGPGMGLMMGTGGMGLGIGGPSDINSSGVTSSSASSLCGIEGFPLNVNVEESGCLTGTASPLPYDIDDIDRFGSGGVSDAPPATLKPTGIDTSTSSGYSSIESFEGYGEQVSAFSAANYPPSAPMHSASPREYLYSANRNGPASPRTAVKLGVNVRQGYYTTDSPGHFPLPVGVPLPPRPPASHELNIPSAPAGAGADSSVQLKVNVSEWVPKAGPFSQVKGHSGNKNSGAAIPNPNSGYVGYRHPLPSVHQNTNFEFGPMNPDDKARSAADLANSPVAHARYLSANSRSLQSYEHGQQLQYQFQQPPQQQQYQRQEFPDAVQLKASNTGFSSAGIEHEPEPKFATLMNTGDIVLTRGSSASNSTSNLSGFDESVSSGFGGEPDPLQWNSADHLIDIGDHDHDHDAHIFGIDSFLKTPPATPKGTSHKGSTQ